MIACKSSINIKIIIIRGHNVYQLGEKHSTAKILYILKKWALATAEIDSKTSHYRRAASLLSVSYRIKFISKKKTTRKIKLKNDENNNQKATAKKTQRKLNSSSFLQFNNDARNNNKPHVARKKNTLSTNENRWLLLTQLTIPHSAHNWNLHTTTVLLTLNFTQGWLNSYWLDFMAIFFTLRVFARNMLRGNRRRITFRILF